MSQVISLPWPPQATSANGSQGKWRAKSEAARDYKAACAALCRETGKGLRKLPEGRGVNLIRVTFCPPSRVHTYDLDNTLNRAKQGLDAVAEAIGVDDALWPAMDLRRGERCKNGAVRVEINPTFGECIP